jgi:hypothetical protein
LILIKQQDAPHNPKYLDLSHRQWTEEELEIREAQLFDLIDREQENVDQETEF